METLLEFFDRVVAPCLKGTTAADYRLQLTHLQRHFERCQQPPRPLRPADLTVDLLRGAIAGKLENGSERGTADKLRRSVRAVWARAAETGLCAEPPRIRRLPIRRQIPTAWTRDEMLRLVCAAQSLRGMVGPYPLSEWFRALLLLAYGSGLRLDAMLATDWSWCVLDEGRITIPPQAQKDDEGLVVFLGATAATALQAMRPLATGPKIWGDWTQDAGRPWRALTRRLRRCIVLAGLRTTPGHVTRRDLWHKIRRTFATHAYIACGDIEQVKEWLGHSDIAITYQYIDRSQTGKRRQADVLPDIGGSRFRAIAAG